MKRRVRYITEMPVLVEAVVEAENDDGYVLRIDPRTIQPLPDSKSPDVVHRYYHGALNDPSDPNLMWMGKAHANQLTEIQ